MTNRDSLHQLVDTLPDEAMEAAERILRLNQRWRLAPPRPDVPTMRTQVRKRINEIPPEIKKMFPSERVKKSIASRGADLPEAFSALDSFRSASGVAQEGEVLVTFTIHRMRAQEVEVEERFSLSSDKDKLRYSVQVKAPGGKEARREFEFDCRQR
jgi:hypothetical protein